MSFGEYGSKIKKLPRFLTEMEVYKMFRIAEKSGNGRDLKILKLLYYFGMRNNEMCNLDVQHIDFNDKTIKLLGSDKTTGRKGAKGGKDRIIPIVEINPLPGPNRTILDDLKEWVDDRKSGPLIEGETEEGKISDRHVRRIVKYYARRASAKNWEEIHPHTLRHSFATHLRNMGVPIEVLQKVLGHIDISTTMIYAHMGVDNLRNDIKKYVWIARARKELPEKLQKIRNEADLNAKLSLQNDLLLDMLFVLLGISPDEIA